MRKQRVALLLGTLIALAGCSTETVPSVGRGTRPVPDNGCRKGATALADAYVLANPIYAMFLGDLESYVARNRAHYAANTDTIRCARVMSRALMSGAIQNYDPNALRRQQELNTRLGSIGISPGPPPANPSVVLYAMSQQISWLADALPAAAMGDYGPLRTPVTEEQQMRAFGAQMLATLLQDPTVRYAFLQQEPLIRESAELERQMVLSIARSLAQ